MRLVRGGGLKAEWWATRHPCLAILAYLIRNTNLYNTRMINIYRRNAECVVQQRRDAKLIAGVPASSRVTGQTDDPTGANTLKTTLQFKLLDVNTLATFVNRLFLRT